MPRCSGLRPGGVGVETTSGEELLPPFDGVVLSGALVLGRVIGTITGCSTVAGWLFLGDDCFDPEAPPGSGTGAMPGLVCLVDEEDEPGGSVSVSSRDVCGIV